MRDEPKECLRRRLGQLRLQLKCYQVTGIEKQVSGGTCSTMLYRISLFSELRLSALSNVR